MFESIVGPRFGQFGPAPPLAPPHSLRSRGGDFYSALPSILPSPQCSPPRLLPLPACSPLPACGEGLGEGPRGQGRGGSPCGLRGRFVPWPARVARSLGLRR